MDMQEFIANIDKRNYGVVSFNTYMQRGINHCFIMIAGRGNTGKFLKEECSANDLNITLQKILYDIYA